MPPQSSKKSASYKAPNKASQRAGRPAVLHLSPHLDPGGAARETVDLAILAQRAGWRSLIASSGGKLVPEAERAAVRHARMPLHRLGLLAGWRNRLHLAALVQKEKPALLHAHGVEAALYALGLARAHRLPLIVDFTQPLPHSGLAERLLKRLDEYGAAVRVPSAFMAKQLREEFGWPEERLRVIPPGVDMNYFNPSAVSAERLQALSKLWRLPEQAFIVVMPMPLADGSGHEALLRAIAKLKRDDIFAVLVGDNRPAPGKRAEIEALVDELKLNGKVVMPDYCLDWPAGLWLASAVVAPNDMPRGMGLELLAAQAMGRPVIVTDCGANGEMVEGGETAWVLLAGDDAMLAEALSGACRLTTDQRLDFAARTRDFVAERFPQGDWAKEMLAFYEGQILPAKKRVEAQAA